MSCRITIEGAPIECSSPFGIVKRIPNKIVFKNQFITCWHWCPFNLVIILYLAVGLFLVQIIKKGSMIVIAIVFLYLMNSSLVYRMPAFLVLYAITLSY